MKVFARKLTSAIAPVLGVCLAIALLQPAGMPFPPALAWEAWAQWAVFAAVVHACTALCMGVASRAFGGDPAGTVPPATSA